ncbi:hypothetical protein CDL12_05731 [Handroanthus impetiginosus]|uniref:Uncharacterized protein n=1 Tax=Handroanthus impetiginosus TaxID=429701 RepID=A0A2G9HVM3_9LAMI|nr:hypothetical protein CDL12_05731 [Handroanthus impetiginosus]
MMQFSGEGGARYFDPKEARKRIHKGDSAHWTYNMITKNKNLLFVDDGKAKELEQDYFIAICSNYLTLRQGEHFVIEPYSPHRFSCQFGYYQEVQGVLRCDFHQADLEDGLCYWRLCTLSKSMSKAWFLIMPPNVKKVSSESYKKWWANIHGDYFDENFETNKRKGASYPVEESSTDRHWKRPKRDSKTAKQIEADGDETGSNQTQAFAKKLEKEIFGINDDEESPDSQTSSTKLNSYTPVATKVSKELVDSPKIKGPSQCIDVSIFEGKKLVLDTQKKFLQMLWDNLCRKISSTPLDSISSIHDDVQVVLTSMSSFDKFDISHLEERLKMLFDRAAVYDTARSASLNKASKEILARQMKEAKDHLHEARIKEGKAKEELNNLEERKRNLLALLDQQQQILQSVQVEVHEIEEEIIALENTSSLSDEVAGNLSTVMKQVEVAKEELENLKPCLKTILFRPSFFVHFYFV